MIKKIVDSFSHVTKLCCQIIGKGPVWIKVLETKCSAYYVQHNTRHMHYLLGSMNEQAQPNAHNFVCMYVYICPLFDYLTWQLVHLTCCLISLGTGWVRVRLKTLKNEVHPVPAWVVVCWGAVMGVAPTGSSTSACCTWLMSRLQRHFWHCVPLLSFSSSSWKTRSEFSWNWLY